MHQEALERNLSADVLREIEVINKTKLPTPQDLLEFQTSNPDKQWNTEQIENILNGIFYNQRLEEYIHSLFDKHDVSLMLLPPHTFSINTSNLSSFDYNNIDSKNEVILIMDFECSHCNVSFEIFRSLAEKYRKNFTFRLIYLTTSYDLKGKALMAAKKQGLDLQLINQMVNFPNKLHDPVFYSDFFENSKGDLESFNSSIIDQMNLTDLLITRDILFSNGIHSTPVFIVNGLIYDHEATPEYLELLIKRELIKE
jgi:thiol-disulfide isomerase/thioredoxin